MPIPISQPVLPKIAFKVRANGDIEWYTDSSNTVTLSVEEEIDHNMIVSSNPTDMDKHIRQTLARKLADKLIEEDLIEISSAFVNDTNTQRFQAKVKIVQE